MLSNDGCKEQYTITKKTKRQIHLHGQIQPEKIVEDGTTTTVIKACIMVRLKSVVAVGYEIERG
jgi:hypothetical protein